MSSAIDKLYPFDGDPPDGLVQEGEAVLDGWIERLGPTLKEAQQEGLTVVLLLGSYDQLAGTTYMRSLSMGDYHAEIGLARRFVVSRESQ